MDLRSIILNLEWYNHGSIYASFLKINPGLSITDVRGGMTKKKQPKLKELNTIYKQKAFIVLTCHYMNSSSFLQNRAFKFKAW